MDGESQNPAAQTDLEEYAKRWGLHTPQSLRARAHALGARAQIIEGLLPFRSVSILLGDSGLGKSSLMYQAALCVAAGVPFLGRETTKGRVLIADFENGIGDMQELVERISGYLGLTEPPSDYLCLWTPNDCEPRYGQNGHSLLDILHDVRPSLAIVDSLASYAPDAEEKNSSASRMLQGFRLLAGDCGTATIFVHHRRKQSRKAEETAGPLESATLRQWFQDSRGASSLINGSDIRLGVDEADLSVVSKDELALVLRGFGRIRGEIGPLFLARDADDNGDPVGYRSLVGANLLFNPLQESALAALPQQFKFKEAKVAYGRGDQPTTNFLQRCIALHLLWKPRRGLYEKTSQESVGNGGASGGMG